MTEMREDPPEGFKVFHLFDDLSHYNIQEAHGWRYQRFLSELRFDIVVKVVPEACYLEMSNIQ